MKKYGFYNIMFQLYYCSANYFDYNFVVVPDIVIEVKVLDCFGYFAIIEVLS